MLIQILTLLLGAHSLQHFFNVINFLLKFSVQYIGDVLKKAIFLNISNS